MLNAIVTAFMYLVIYTFALLILLAIVRAMVG